MSVELFRVDERLVHGQVVLGWGRVLKPDRYVVVDDELAGSEWEQDLYRLAVEDEELLFLTAEDAASRIPDLIGDGVRTVVLTRDVDHMVRLARGGGVDGAVNLGGLHHRPGRVEEVSYLHLDETDRAGIQALLDLGLEVSGQDLPDAAPVPAETLLA